MSIEFQKLSPNLQRSATKPLLRQRIQQLCMRLVVEPIFSRPRYYTGVKVLVGQVQLAGRYLGKQLSVAIERRVEACLE